MLKFENKFAVGDVIKSFDFQPMPDRGDCFIEGEVIAAGMTPMGFKAFTVKVTRDVFSGEESTDRIGEEMFVPMGVSIMEYDERVTLVEAAA